MQKSISDELFNSLKENLSKSWIKNDKNKFNSSSVAITSSNKYFSGLVESQTNLLDITSEHASLVLAISNKDAFVNSVISLVSGEFILNPLIVKILCDHVRRTGVKLSYSVFDLYKNNLFYCEDIMELYYKPPVDVLEKIKDWKFRNNFIYYDLTKDLAKQLKECALLGTETHFSSSSKSLYGASILVGNKIYFAGVHSSFGKRLNLHAEMSVFLSALSDGNTSIEALGIVSTKFKNDIAHVCGCCRQFLSEIQNKNGISIEVYCFSYETENVFKIKLEDYFPYAWDHKFTH